MLVVSVGALLIAIRLVRRETRVRPGRDVIRFAIALGTALFMTALADIETPGGLVAAAVVGGAALGIFQGRNVVLRVAAGETFAQRSTLGIIGWGGGIAVTQAAGVVNRAEIAHLGMAGAFFGASLIGGLIVGRAWEQQQARPAAGTAVLLLVAASLALFAGAARADTVDEDAVPSESTIHDISDVHGGSVPGVTISIEGTGNYWGLSVRIVSTNTSSETLYVRVPVGLKLNPGTVSVQTMITAGGEIIAIPPTPADAPPQTDDIAAFCGEMHDGVPGSGEIFTPGGFAEPRVRQTAENIHTRGQYDYTSQEALWAATDDLDVSDDPLASQMLAPESALPPEAAIKLSLAGLVGQALVLATALVNAGLGVDDVLTAWRDDKWTGLQGMVEGATGGLGPATDGDPFIANDVFDDLSNEAVRELTSRLSPEEAQRINDLLVKRLQAEETNRALQAIRDVIGPLGPTTNVTGLIEADRVREILNALPEDQRSQFESDLVDLLEKERQRVAAETGWGGRCFGVRGR
jgi:hypothetical protein